MKYDPERHHRRSIRLKRYDYTHAGAYFVTIVTQNRECVFGEVVYGAMRLNDAGRMAEQCWQAIPNHFPNVALDVFVVMPNHVHGIVCIVDKTVGAKNFSPLQCSSLRSDQRLPGTSKTIGSIVRGFKIGVTKRMRANRHVQVVWQRNYYEHIIRDESSLNRIRQYILDNPLGWQMDRENPDVVRTRGNVPLPTDEPWRT